MDWSTPSIREPAVAGSFYPADPAVLREQVRGFLAHAEGAGPAPKALIVPHAGYAYSGPIAASGYARLLPARDTIRTVVLLGPAHRVAFEGLAAPQSDAFATPLGTVTLDRAGIRTAMTLPQVALRDDAHVAEHSLEVQLPFLQEVLARFTLVPLVVGDASAVAVAEVLELLWGGAETLIVISSDLSHYHDYESARRLDTATSRAIEALAPAQVHPVHACGCRPLGGLLLAARAHDLTARTIDLRSSGDTAGPAADVVGYGAYTFVEPAS